MFFDFLCDVDKNFDKFGRSSRAKIFKSDENARRKSPIQLRYKKANELDENADESCRYGIEKANEFHYYADDDSTIQ